LFDPPLVVAAHERKHDYASPRCWCGEANYPKHAADGGTEHGCGRDPKPCQFCHLPTYGEWHSCCNAQAARIAQLEAAIARAKAIDPYTGIGARGAALADSDATSEYARAYRDAVHDALEVTPPETKDVTP
jgi:hypothetical protein